MVDVLPSWATRVAPFVVLVSPLFSTFTAKWKGDPRTFEKNVQRDKFPLIAGEYGKDLGSGAEEYTITMSFDGMNCDALANSFYQACKEVGTWTVNHPVHGIKKLQLLRVTEVDDPVKSGGVVTVTTEWFEPLDWLAIPSAPTISALFLDMSLLSVSAMYAALLAAGFGAISSVLSTASIIGSIASIAASETWAAVTSVSLLAASQESFGFHSQNLSNNVTDTHADTAAFDPEAIGTALHGMIAAPAYGAEDPTWAIENLSGVADSIISLLPSGASHIGIADVNKAYTAQTSLEATVGAACLAQSFATHKTRSQAVEAAQSLAAMFESVVSSLDGTQAGFEALRANRQYYGQTETYSELKNLVSYTISYLLRQTFDLAVEKRFTLEREKTPLQICFDEFKQDGESKFDDFIVWNQLEGDDIIVLPAGREVVVYVGGR